jgi:hypothetical protein
MKKFMFIAPVTLLAAFLILGTAFANAPGSGRVQTRQNGWYCPYGALPGGDGMGPGMMWPGYSYNQQNLQPQRPITERDAKGIVENYLNSTRNPNLKLGKIKDEGSAFEADIVTKSNGSLVDKMLVSKDTGWLHSAY